jgi:tetratricopeptide (TPR) repeat protein
MPGIEGIEIGIGTSSRPIKHSRTVLPSWLTRRLENPRIIPLALVLVAFLVFLPTLWNGFVEWDDQVTLYQNEEYRGLTWPHVRWMLTTMLMGHWIPLTWLTFGLDYVIWGMNPLGYHLTSLVIFTANVPVIYFIALRLLQRATSFADGTLRVSAFVAALFFAIHPLRVESVAWATERRDVLSGLFFLLTVLMYLKAVDADGRRRLWLLAGSVGMYGLALVSKASVMILPLALIVLDVYPLRRLGGSASAWTAPAARAVWLEKIPFLILGAAGAAVTYYAQNASAFITPLERYPLSARPAMVFWSLWFYVEKTILPQGLTPLYELPVKVSLLDPKFFLAGMAVISITTTVVVLRRRVPGALAVWVYYAIALGPVIGIVHSGHQLTNDRYSYLPGLGLSLLIGAAAGAAVQAAAAGTLRPVLAKMLAGLGVLWLCALAYLSAQQIRVWRDTESLWRYSLESDPSCSICHGNLGVFLSMQGHFGLAHAEFERVRALRPDNMKVHLHIGYTYAMGGNFDRAVEHFELYVGRYPNDVDGLNNLGSAMLSSRRPAEAFHPLKRVLLIKPRNALAHVNLGFAHLELRQYAEALRFFRSAIALQHESPQAWYGLARVNYETGDLRGAQTAWGMIGQLDPKFAVRLGPMFLQTW